MFGTWPSADNVAQVGGPNPKAGCNCEHLRGTCAECSDDIDVATDGGPGYARCGDCDETYQSLSAARICCSDDQDDDPDSPLLCDGGRQECPACGYLQDEFDTTTVTQCGRRIKRDKCSRCGRILDEVSREVRADGGAPMKRPESTETDDVSPAVVKALESRVDSLEDNQQRADQTRTDLVALINDLQTQVDELRTRVEHLEDDAGGDPQ